MSRAVLAAGLAAALAGPAAAGFDFDSHVLLSDGMFNGNPSVVVDDSGAIHLAYYAQFDTSSPTREVWYATDAAGAWTFTQLTDDAWGDEWPYLALDGDGHAHIAFNTNFGGQNRIRYTTNAGGSFSAPVEVTAAGSYYKPKLVVDDAGVVHFVMNQQTSGDSDVYYTTWTPGVGAGPLVNLSNTAGVGDWDPHIARGPDGVLHVAYYTGTILGGGTLKYANNESGTFQHEPTGVPGAVLYQVIGVGDDGTVSIAYRVGDQLRLVARPAGGAFGEPVFLTPNGAYRPAFFDRLAVEGGRRYLAFANNINTRGAYFIGETDEGFEPAVRLPGDDATTWVGASVGAGGGRLAVAYTRGRVEDSIVMTDLFIATAGLGGCPADFDGDGGLTPADFAAFRGVFLAGDPRADADGDGDLTAGDFAAFRAAFLAGCG